jgi:hypothetical protein
MKRCWASALGDCSGRISGEHVFSKGLFAGKLVTISGSPWSLGGIKTIGVKGLESHVLCEKHNSLLSPVDVEGINAFRLLRQIDAEVGYRDDNQNGTWDVVRYAIDGNLLERWFLKTTMNIVSARGSKQKWSDDPDHIDPPANLVRAAFGQERLRKPAGLYLWAGQAIGEKVRIDDQIHVAPVVRNGGVIVGAHFVMRGLQFLIWLLDQEVPWEFVKPFYHHMGGDFCTRKGIKSHELRYAW